MFPLNITNRFHKISVFFVELCYSGIKSGHVPDSAMTASSSWSNEYQAFYGRLDNTGNVRSLWAPARGINKNLNLLILCDFRSTWTFD